jgi:predicted regulator of Ras-like GTPase activity (Roadblock/LC7/MglB family)
MSLVTSLQSILDGLEEAEGIALVGVDGIIVNEVKRSPDIDLQAMAAEYCGLWREMDRVSGGLSHGPTQECMIANDARTLVFRRVTPEYFLALSVARDGNTGKGRFLLRYAALQLAKDL